MEYEEMGGKMQIERGLKGDTMYVYPIFAV